MGQWGQRRLRDFARLVIFLAHSVVELPLKVNYALLLPGQLNCVLLHFHLWGFDHWLRRGGDRDFGRLEHKSVLNYFRLHLLSLDDRRKVVRGSGRLQEDSRVFDNQLGGLINRYFCGLRVKLVAGLGPAVGHCE